MKWEYIVIVLDKLIAIQENQLIEAGKEGWQLVCVSDGRAYLCRQVFDEEEFSVKLMDRAEERAGKENTPDVSCQDCRCGPCMCDIRSRCAC